MIRMRTYTVTTELWPVKSQTVRAKKFEKISDAVEDYKFLLSWYNHPSSMNFITTHAVRVTLRGQFGERDIIIERQTFRKERHSD